MRIGITGGTGLIGSALRNHLIDFLVTRSRSFKDEIAGLAWDRRHPPAVRPSATPFVHP